MKRNNICAVITGDDRDSIKAAAQKADMFELRIDLIGSKWPAVASWLDKPWIATNRSISQHGNWNGDEKKRTAELAKALELGAWMADIELDSAGLNDFVKQAGREAKYMVSYHNWEGTPSISKLKEIVRRELALGAYACKVVTTAGSFEDNITVLRLPGRFPTARIVTFAMGREGILSRVLSPLAGGYFTYASINNRSASAPGQVTTDEMNAIYGLLE